LSNTTNTYIYAITNGTDIKIGYSSNVKRRLKQLNTGSSINLYVLCTFKGGRELESEIHSMFKKIRYNGEWFRADKELLEYLNLMSDDVYVDWDRDLNCGKLRGYLKMKM
jgi:hypothetical protein